MFSNSRLLGENKDPLEILVRCGLGRSGFVLCRILHPFWIFVGCGMDSLYCWFRLLGLGNVLLWLLGTSGLGRCPHVFDLPSLRENNVLRILVRRLLG